MVQSRAMKHCPNCSGPISLLEVARHLDTLVCPCCGVQLHSDRRSSLCMFGALALFLPFTIYLIRHMNGRSLVFGFVLGFIVATLAGAACSLAYAITVRFHCHRAGDSRPATARPRMSGGLV